jgi:hypothetical protein
MTPPNRVISRREFLRSIGVALSVYSVAPPLTATPLTNTPLPNHSSIRVEAADEVLPNDFLIHSTPFFENTAKAIPPGSSCPGGKIVINVGQVGGWNTGKLLHRPLFEPGGNIDTTSMTAEVAFPTGSTKAVATDNQLVRLKDGTLLALRDGFIWDDISPNPPVWFNEIIDGFGRHKGQRGGPLVFRSPDCGEHWTLYSTLDLATILGGKYGYPRPMAADGRVDVPVDQQGRDAEGNLLWFAAGADRTELYACPFTGHVYLTTRVFSGPYKDIAPQQNTLLLFYSKDRGKSWEAIKEDFPTWSPLVMTSTPNGRLFLFQCIGDQPTVYFSKEPVSFGVKPEISAGYPVNYIEDGNKIPNATVDPKAVDLFLQLFHPTISRISTDRTSSKVRVVYHARNEHGMQEARVLRIEVRNSSEAPVVIPVKTVRAETPTDYSVMYFTFIDPDYIDMPAGVRSNTSVLYWIEASRVGLSNPHYAIRYMVFEGDFNTTCPAYLSVQDGRPRTWSTRQDLGDYMSGGFFWKDYMLNYVAQWVDPTGIRANIIARPYQPPSGTPDMTVTAVWEESGEPEIQVYEGSPHETDFKVR